MPRPIINEDECSGCGICVDACPNGVLELVGDVAEAVNEDDCTACATCEEECPMGAITEIEED
jgi:NAD-dependent dihydropyrimidine dehydrogenase PreA subunit